ncbi:MAG: DUF2914 domain-containing protein [Myxococcota bacterium]
MNASPALRAIARSILALTLPAALVLGCTTEDAPEPAPPENPAAKWSVPAAREAAPPAIPSVALTKPVMSEAERRAIAEARQPPPAPVEAGATAEPALPEETAPAAPGALSPEDLRALRDDPAAHPLPDPEPIAAADPAEELADVPRAVLPPPAGTVDSPAPTERIAPPPDSPKPTGDETEGRPGVLLSANSDPNLSLLDLAVATAVVDREPEGASDRFDATPSLFLCYSSFDQRNESATVTHVWTWNDREMARVELEVGKSPKWRTWSRQRLQPDQAGRWACEVLGPDGARLGIARVTVGR